MTLVIERDDVLTSRLLLTTNFLSRRAMEKDAVVVVVVEGFRIFIDYGSTAKIVSLDPYFSRT